MTAAVCAIALFLGGMIAAHAIAAACGTTLYRISRGMPRRSIK